MANKEFICISCPRGCRLVVDEGLNVTGNSCNRGETYGKSEAVAPLRNLSTTIPLIDGEISVLPVKTSNPIPKGKIEDVMREIKKISVNAPININDIIIEDCLGLGINIVSCRTVERRK